MSLYNIKSTPQADQFSVTKFDDDLNPESSYIITKGFDGHYGCTCPAAQRTICRHRSMMPMLSLRVDSPWFLDFDTRQWVDPTGAASEASSLAEVCQTCHGSKTIYPKLDSGRIACTAVPCPDCSGPQDSLGSDLTAQIPLREVHEESHTYEPTTKLPDTHPFRRRM